MSDLALQFGSIFGALAIVFGAFGAHALKKILNEEQLKSFETGVKYQMYHAIALLVVGFNLDASTSNYSYIVWCFIIGVFLFSFSIYALVISSAKGKKMKFLGPITPIGGLLLLLGWILLFINFL